MVKTDKKDYKQYVVERNSNSYWKVEEKIQLVMAGSCKQVAVTTLCRVNNVSPPLYYEWKKLFFAGAREALLGKGSLSQREVSLEKKVSALERYIGELILEKELLKKTK